ncbi:MAG: hypothetical protein HQK83_17715 [Fibrobacteria bacterium]|nr:hypothetical protein [Fibrobacteria bacterium]
MRKKQSNSINTRVVFLLGIILLLNSVWAKAKYRYPKAGEDTVRVLIVYNENVNDSWHCPQGLGYGGCHAFE